MTWNAQTSKNSKILRFGADQAAAEGACLAPVSEQPRQPALLALLDRFEQVLGRLAAHPFQPHQSVEVQPVQVAVPSVKLPCVNRPSEALEPPSSPVSGALALATPTP